LEISDSWLRKGIIVKAGCRHPALSLHRQVCPPSGEVIFKKVEEISNILRVCIVTARTLNLLESKKYNPYLRLY